jgi:tRNA-2-methylthio-N6-dimethylallyladenosine synthase
MNDFDSQRIRGLLQSRGFVGEEDPAQADIIVLNTCSIRDKAEQKVYSQIGVFRKYKRERPELILGVAGCMAQEHGEELLRQVPEIDLVVGPQSLYRMPELIQGAIEGRRRSVSIEENELVQPIEYETVVRPSQVKAYVTVMEGCDYLCSFCIVPYTRGREKNRAPEDIEREVRWLCGQGWREIVLLGQTVNKYRHGSTGFAQLLRRLDPVPGLERLRFTSPYPTDFTPELIQAMAELRTVCEHFHMPVQSGSSRVLKKMRRRYSREEYLRRVEQIRQRVPGAALSTDVIVGFPTETEEEFCETLSLIERVGFDQVFAFCYSERPGTGASHLADDVPEAVKRRRLNELFSVQLPIARRRNEALIGTLQEVLVEGPSGREAREALHSAPGAPGSPGQMTGRTRTNKIVNFPARPDGPRCSPGDLVQMQILEASAHSLRGELVSVLSAAFARPAAPDLVQIA